MMKNQLTASLLLAMAMTIYSCQNNTEQPSSKKITPQVEEKLTSESYTLSYKEKEDNNSISDFVEETEVVESSSNKSSKFKNVADLLSTFKKPVQTFSANAGKIISITGHQGTELTFAANSLVLESGDAVRGDVQILLEEYYNTSDIVFGQLSTATKDNLLEPEE